MKYLLFLLAILSAFIFTATAQSSDRTQNKNLAEQERAAAEQSKNAQQAASSQAALNDLRNELLQQGVILAGVKKDIAFLLLLGILNVAILLVSVAATGYWILFGQRAPPPTKSSLGRTEVPTSDSSWGGIAPEYGAKPPQPATPGPVARAPALPVGGPNVQPHHAPRPRQTDFGESGSGLVSDGAPWADTAPPPIHARTQLHPQLTSHAKTQHAQAPYGSGSAHAQPAAGFPDLSGSEEEDYSVYGANEVWPLLLQVAADLVANVQGIDVTTMTQQVCASAKIKYPGIDLALSKLGFIRISGRLAPDGREMARDPDMFAIELSDRSLLFPNPRSKFKPAFTTFFPNATRDNWGRCIEPALVRKTSDNGLDVIQTGTLASGGR